MKKSISDVAERFIRYVKIDTESCEDVSCFPSTDNQFHLARLLTDELECMGAENVYLDEKHCYVYAQIPENDGGLSKKVIGFISHMDTSPEISGKNVNPQIVNDYDGEDIFLSKDKKYILSPKNSPEITSYVGKNLITTDGQTLLGADDKAGIAEIMSMAKRLLEDRTIKHGRIAIAFTPDEEIGKGIEYFDLKRFGADFAYTVDGGKLGEVEYENFNAASLKVITKGRVVHPGEAKNKLINSMSIAMEFDRLLPVNERPEYTEGYEGFYYLTDISGTTEQTSLNYLIRDHQRVKFEERKNLAMKIRDVLNAKYGNGAVEIEICDSYYNMSEIIDPQYIFLIDMVKEAMIKERVTPTVQPIRGGTDGARLSFLGLPCPNICTGGHNFHGRYEYICIESMETIVNILINIVNDLIL